MKQIKAAIACCALMLTACSGSPAEEPTNVTTTTTSLIGTTSNASTKSSTGAIKQQHIDQFMAGVTSTVNEVPADDVDGRLSVIVTAYCTIKHTHDQGIAVSDVVVALSELYDNNWHAGGKWSYGLKNAAQQPGGCPTPPTPTDTDG